MLDWLIIGGGIHGTYLSHYLTAGKGVGRDRLRVLDPHDVPLARWNITTGNVGMRYMRSPQVHHLDVPLDALERYAADHPAVGYRQPFHRPTYDLFQCHTQHVIQTHRLTALRIRDYARGIGHYGAGLRVETGQGSIEARRVILAIGRTHLRWPDWAFSLRQRGAPVHHIFAPGFERDKLPDWSHLVIIGGGITAAQTALAYSERAPGTVTLLMRHDLRTAYFDSSPCWLGRGCLTAFRRTPAMARRRWMIDEARKPGSMPGEDVRALRQAEREGALRRIRGDVLSADYGHEQVTLTLADESTLLADRVLLCTGFDSARPGAGWLDRMIEDLGLPTADCGFPIVDTDLCWGHGLYVSGSLAELEIGPAAGNIIGGRMAAERIGQVV